MKEIKIVITDEICMDLEAYLKATGKDVGETMQEALKLIIAPLQGEDGKVSQTKGMWLSTDGEKKCIVVRHTTMFGEPYFNIYVPADRKLLIH